MKKSNRDRVLKRVTDQHEMAGFKGNLNRARSITVGTACGGAVELMMRLCDGKVVWFLMQPVEVVELVHQLASSVGCHIHMQPRTDFASWRKWKEAPFGSDFPPFANHAPLSAPPPTSHAIISTPRQPGLQPALMAKEKQDEQAVAAKKTVRRKRTKRTPTPA